MRENVSSATRRRNVVIDFSLLVFFVAVYLLGESAARGAAESPPAFPLLHSGLGLAMAAILLFHLGVHWTWIKANSRLIFSGLSARLKWRYWTNVFALAAYSVIVLSGVMMYLQPGESGGRTAGWVIAHHIGGKAVLLATLLHVFQHREWLVKAFSFHTRSAPAPAPVGLPSEGAAHTRPLRNPSSFTERS